MNPEKNQPDRTAIENLHGKERGEWVQQRLNALSRGLDKAGIGDGRLHYWQGGSDAQIFDNLNARFSELVEANIDPISIAGVGELEKFADFKSYSEEMRAKVLVVIESLKREPFYK